MPYKIFIVILLLLQGCKIFTTRSSEPPAQESNWNAFPLNPSDLEENLEHSFEYRQNTPKYKDIFTEDFVFYFDRQDQNEFNIPVSWQKKSEIQMLTLLHNETSAKEGIEIELTLTAGEEDEITVNTAILYRDYTVNLPPNVSGLGNTFKGKLRLHLKENNGIWKLSKWYDFRTGSNPASWGRLKDEFSM